MNWVNNIKIRHKLLLLVLLPMVGFFYYASQAALRTHRVVEKMQHHKTAIELAVQVGNLIHETQKERGISAGFISSDGKIFANQLGKQRKSVNERRMLLDNFYKNMRLHKSLVVFDKEFKSIFSRLERLPDMRALVDDHRPGDLNKMVGYFSDINSDFIRVISLFSLDTADIELSHLLKTFYVVLKLKESAGKERAALTVVFSRDKISFENLQQAAALINEQLLLTNMFLINATPEQKVFYEKSMKNASVFQVEEIRAKALGVNEHIRLISELNNAHGFGGLIHNFKNYILRGDKRYSKKFLKIYNKTNSLLENAIRSGSYTPKRKKQFAIIRKTIGQYRKNLDTAILMAKAGKSPAEIDQAVRITDSALITALLQISSDNILDIDAQYWFATSSKKIDLFKQLENRIGEDILLLSETLIRSAKITQNTVFATLIAGFAITFGLIFWMSRIVTRPIFNTINTMRQIADGNLSVPALAISNDEIGVLAQAINRVTRTLKEVTQQANIIASGNYQIDITPRSEQDDMGVALQNMTATLKDVAHQANVIAAGNYQADIKPRSEKDELGIALRNMTTTLRDAETETRTRDWLKTGQTSLADAIRGELTPATIASNVLRLLCEYIGAQVGTFYVFNAETKQLVLLDSYALTQCNETFDLGKGIAGQAGLEKKIISITDIPDDYLTIVSSIGESRPRHLAVIPLLHNDQLFGVIEFGTLKAFDETAMELLQSQSESISIALQTSQARKKVAQLLEESQAQTEELQTQQEELKTANEELEEQTQLLRQSEEELKTSNEELEEKSEILEEQKEAIEEKNSEVEQKIQELATASKYKSEFLANMSHELRTPLNSLLILAKSLCDNKDKNLTAKQIERINVIHKSGQDLLELINDILDLSKVEAGKLDIVLKPVNFKELCHALKMIFTPQTKNKGIKFKIENRLKADIQLQSDSRRIEQILKNLLSNALKFTSQGSITLRLEEVEPGAKLERIKAIAISVIDTGIGIPQEKQDAIFEAFQQADGTISRKYGGTGLGLTISGEMSRLLGGNIQLQSTEGKGSKFTLSLPLTFVCPSSDPAITEQSASKPRQKIGTVTQITAQFIPDDRGKIDKNHKSVLIVEDDPTFAQTLYQLAHNHGYQGIVAGTALDCIKLAEQYGPSAIILDLNLPDMKGEEVLGYLKENLSTRHIPVHIISGREPEPPYLKKNAIGILIKPISEIQIKALFSRFDEMLVTEQKNILLVEDSKTSQKSITDLLANEKTIVTVVPDCARAKSLLAKQRFHCILLDLNLPDGDGLQCIQLLREQEGENLPPVILCTDKVLSDEEFAQANQLAQSVIVKGNQSSERLLDETMLFLHHVESTLPEKQRTVIEALHDQEAVFKDKKILLVDDDVRNLFSLSGTLSDRGMNVSLAEHGQIALDKLNADPDFNLILMDIMMPEMDGYEAIKKIRADARFQHIPIIALTAKAMVEDREKCIQSGASDYFTKPVDTEKLLSLMRIWLHQY